MTNKPKTGTQLASGLTDFSGLTGQVVSVRGCTLLYCESGMAVASSHFCSRMVLRIGSVVLLFEDSEFMVSRVSRTFVCRYVEVADHAITDLFYKFGSVEFWEFIYRSPVLRPDSEFLQWQASPTSPSGKHLARDWFLRIDWLLRTFETEDCLLMARGELQNLFLTIDRLRPPQTADSRDGGSSSLWLIVDRLHTLLLRHIQRERSVQFYASELCISPDYLNRVCQRVLGKSTKTIINEMTVRQIKILLSDTSLTVAEIARRLNYDNVPYLCRFFRNATGLSPLEYREH